MSGLDESFAQSIGELTDAAQAWLTSNGADYVDAVAADLETLFAAAHHEAWEQGLRHALEWLGQPQMIEAMTKDNPYKERT